MQGIELQIVQGVTGLLALAVTAAISYLSPRAKRWIGSHSTAQVAGVADKVMWSLSGIAEAVVQDFNQRVVGDAKAAGTWTPALAASVKADAVKAVMDQGSQLVKLGTSVVGNVESLVGSLVEQAVARGKSTPVLVSSASVAKPPDPAATPSVSAPAASA